MVADELDDLGVPVTSSAAALVMAKALRSLTLVWKITLLPSLHISVTRVSPGMTVPAKRTLMFLKGPYFW